MKCMKCQMRNPFVQEFYVAPVTASYPEWVNTITEGNTRPFVDTIRMRGSVGNGAVLQGHVRQNAMTANLPYTSITPPAIPEWNS